MVKTTVTERAQEVFCNEAMGNAPPLASDDELDNLVHPLFRQANILWTDSKDENCRDEDMQTISDDTYAAMLPVLRLATLLITEPNMFQPWDHIANSRILDDSAEDDEFGRRYLAKSEFEGTPLGLEYVKSVFEYMSTHVKIRFWDDFSEAKELNTQGPAIYQPDMTRDCMVHRGHGCSNLRRRFLDYFAEHMQHDRPAHQLATSFLFTRVLVLEIAHLFYYSFRGAPVSYIDDKVVEHRCAEPPYEQAHSMHELGHAYELWLLGGHLAPPTYKDQFSAPNVAKAPVICMVLYKWVVDPRDDCLFEYVGVTESASFLTAKVVQMWWSETVWKRIREEGHGFVMEEAFRSRIFYWDDMEPSYDGVVYKTLEFEGVYRNTCASTDEGRS